MASVFGYVKLAIIYLVGFIWGCLVLLQVLRLAITKRGKFFYKKDRKEPPACLNDPELGTHRYVQLPKQGVKLHYVESGKQQQQQPAVVMLHGFPEFWYSWRHQIRLLNKTHRVLALDLRGYGGSSKPTAISKYHLSELVEDIKEFIEILELSPCVIMAHDWGGAIAWSLSGQYPHLVDKAVIMNCPHPRAMGKYMQKSWKQFMKSWYMFFVILPYYPEWFFSSGDLKMLENAFTGRGMGAKPGAFTPEDMEAFKYTFNTMWDFTGPMNYIRASLTRLAMSSKKPPGSKKTGTPVIEDTPLLLLWGTRDGALNNEMAELSRDYVKQFQLQFIEGASHWVQQDEPELVNKHVMDFLNISR